MSSAFFDPDDFDTSAPAPVSRPPVSNAQVPAAMPALIPAPMPAPAVNEPVLTTTEEKPKFFELKPVGAVSPPTFAQPEPAAAAPVAPAEPIRMPEPLELPSDFPQFVAPDGLHVDLSDLGIGSDEPRTRRQLRELQRLTGSDVVNEPVEEDLAIESEFELQPDLAEQIEVLDADTTPTSFEVKPATADDFSYLNNQNEPLFDVSPGLVIEPTTNSIIIDQVQDLTNYTATVSENGEILTTGEIQLPIELTDNSTGEIQIIQEAAALDSAIQVDNATGFINTIAPMRVTGVVNSASKFKVIPTNLRRGSSHPYMVLAAAVGMAALGSLVIAAMMLQLI
jgi:hypothetical protein